MFFQTKVPILTKSNPSPFSYLVVEWREAEDIAKDRCVEDLDTDVSVEQSSNQARDEGDGVSESLPSICRIWNSCKCQSRYGMEFDADIPW